MVDRLEELLALLEEEDGEEREDVLGLEAEVPSPPVPGTGAEKALEDGGRKAGPGLDEGNAPAEAGALEWMPDRVALLPIRQDGVPEAGGGAGAGLTGGDTAGDKTEEFLWDGLAAVVMDRDGSVALRRPGAGDVETGELAGAAVKTAAVEELDAVMDAVRSAERGLEGLYQQVVQADRPVSQGLTVGQAGRNVWVEEPGRTAALTVDELDRAVRRDSRRYDGGMTIY